MLNFSSNVRRLLKCSWIMRLLASPDLSFSATSKGALGTQGSYGRCLAVNSLYLSAITIFAEHWQELLEVLQWACHSGYEMDGE